LPDSRTDKSVAGQPSASVVAEGRQRWSPMAFSATALVLLALVVALSVYLIHQRVERRLNALALSALAANDIEVADLELDWDYRNLTLSGSVPADVRIDMIEEVLRATDDGGIRRLVVRVDAKQTAQNSTASGTVDVVVRLADQRISMDGTVLTRAQREQLHRAAVSVVGAGQVANQLKVSGLAESIAGANGRVGSLADALAGLDKAAEAEAVLSATDLRFNATVDEQSDADDLLRRRQGAGDVGLVISGDIIARKSDPQGELRVRAIYKDNRLLLSGVVADERQHQFLLDAAAQVVDGNRVSDDITVSGAAAAGNPADARLALVASAMSRFAALDSAQVELDQSTLVVDAEFEFEEDTEAMRAVVTRARALGLTTSGTISARQLSMQREIELLQRDIDAIETEVRENVVFASAGTELGFTAKSTLDKIVDAMNRYPRPLLEVRGHTDNTGSAEANSLLSLERAIAVRDYLAQSGILAGRLRALGLGESDQVASNQTEVGRRMNRRVEFIAREDFQN